MLYTTVAFGEHYTVDTEKHTLTLTTAHDTQTFSHEQMRDIANSFRGMNRMDKPTALNYYTDCHNGKAGNWR